MTRNLDVTAAANELFGNLDEGMMNAKSQPVMFTPLAVVAAEYAVAGSTICLVC